MIFFLRNTLKERFQTLALNEAVYCGVETNAQSVLFFFFRDFEKKPFIVVKATRDSQNNTYLKQEFEKLSLVRRILPDKMKDSIPGTHGCGEWRGHFFYLQNFIDGSMLPDIIDDIDIESQSNKKIIIIESALKWLIEFQLACSTKLVKFSEFRFEKLIDLYQRVYQIGQTERGYFKQLKVDLTEKRNCQVRMVYCHGDFFTDNIIFSSKSINIIDWRFFRRCYHPLFDFTMFLITLIRSENNDDAYNVERTFRSSFFVKNWISDFIISLTHMHIRQKIIGQDLLIPLFELSLLELATRDYSSSRVSSEKDELWRKRFLFYIANKNRFILKDLK